MSSLKKLCLALATAFVATPLFAQPDPLLLRFATCTGRFSAELEHQWLVYDPNAEKTERIRNNLADLLEALVTPDDAHIALNQRITAKQAHARLLQRGTFNTNDLDATWATRKAEQDIASCAAILLGSPQGDERV